MGPGLPTQVRTLIVERISSVVQVEVLLLLHADRARVWSAADVATQLRIDPAGADAQLAGLVAQGLIQRVDGPAANPEYQYVASPHDAAVAELAQAYNDLRVSVISLIYSKPSDTLKTFADAFRIRKEKD